ncbi:MAG: class I SAM-dependent methyltransferase [Bacilli bacterium]
MNVDGILPFARYLMQKTLHPHSIAIDATCGNGNDTLFLAKEIGPKGHVYGFDVQQQAIENTALKLEKEQIKNVTLVPHSHANAHQHVAVNHHGTIDCAIFNLGYLPGSDKSVTTVYDSTIAGIHSIYNMMRIGGILVLVLYHGHEEGAKERDVLLDYIPRIPQEDAHALQYGFINQVNTPPFIIALEKRTDQPLPNFQN